jgi:mono/diheme cytochrome c family protein
MNDRPAATPLDRSTNAWMVAGAILMILLLITFLAAAVTEPSRRDDARRDLTAALVGEGHDVFLLHCSACHGVAGEGITASALDSRQFLTTTVDAQIEAIVAAGVPGSDMAPFSIDFGGPLTARQIDAVTAWLRSLEPDAPDRPDWRDMES